MHGQRGDGRTRRSLRGNVDRNASVMLPVKLSYGRSLRGNVDRNSDLEIKEDESYVVPYVGTWIEISTR